ncbi:MAG: putative inorganic carbon transporter subunit DabA, partial [Chitinophagaceae bacterium]
MDKKNNSGGVSPDNGRGMEGKSHPIFDEEHVLHELKHYLPSQQALKDFIHHNTLHAFQHFKFYEAIFRASRIFGFQVHLQLEEYRELCHSGRIRKDIVRMVIARKRGDDAVNEWEKRMLRQEYDTVNHPRIGQLRAFWKQSYSLDLDNRVHPLLFRILCAFLDQGIAVEEYPVNHLSFVESLRVMERQSISSFFRTKEVRRMFQSGDYTITGLLTRIVGRDEYFEQYLFDQQFAHHGWSGFVSAVEDNPHTLLDRKLISLKELVEFELLLELDVLNATLGQSWQPLAIHVTVSPADLFAEVPVNEFQEVIELWQDAFEWSYYDSVLKGLELANTQVVEKQYGLTTNDSGEKDFQAIFCIDEREDSIRRHIEAINRNCETFGAPGFFGVEFYFQQKGSKFYDKLCPAPVTPKYLIKEIEARSTHKGEPLYSKLTHHVLSGFFLSMTYGFWALAKKAQMLFRPRMSPAISNAYGHMTKNSVLTIENIRLTDRENDLQIGYTTDEMATRAEGFLRGIGLVGNFAPVVYFVAHGSSSANNPHHGAHDCGACSGRPGATNARIMAFILNHRKVREILATKGIKIPDQTQFVGSMHDTAADVMGYYDEEILKPENA